MTLFRLTPENFETFTLTAHRTISFISGNNVGTTGSVPLLQKPSPAEKRLKRADPTLPFDDSSLAAFLENTVASANKEGSKPTSIVGSVSKYMELVTSSSRPVSHDKKFEVKYISPLEADYSPAVTGSAIKVLLRDILMPSYRMLGSRMSYAFTNYHSLNFFTASGLPANSALLYPSSASVPDPNGFVSGSYALTGAWTIEFFLNPRYTTDSPASAFTAGTIMHLSSSYAVSLMTGSSRDAEGFPNAFRLVLQLSHSADVRPSRAIAGNYPNDLIFSSSDNSLRRGKWHHCALRWGGSSFNAGSGSIVIDGEVNTTFVVPSSSIAPQALKSSGNPDVLVIGNFYEGINNGTSPQHKFFSAVSETREGTISLQGGSAADTANDMPVDFNFDHGLNAELHEIRLHDRFLTLTEIKSGSRLAPTDISKLKFYLPPFFRKTSRQRWMLETPFYQTTGSSVDPVNPVLMFSVGGHDLNLENFLQDFATGQHPRLLYLTSSRNTAGPAYVTANRTPNTVLFDSPAHRKRNLSILPCDNGLFSPNFKLLLTGTFSDSPVSGTLLDKYVDDNGSLTLSLINLSDMMSTGAFSLPVELSSSLNGPTHQFMTKPPSKALSRLELLTEAHSSAISLFTLSNAMYGSMLQPETIGLVTTALTCSSGKVRISLRDNGVGMLYRADAISKHAKWNSVGVTMYNEGIVAVLAPTLPFFGRDQFSFGAKSSKDMNVFRINVLAPAGAVNSSSNLSYKNVPVSQNDDSSFVYITDVVVMDEDLNVIMRSALAQPIKKKTDDSFLFRLRYDF